MTVRYDILFRVTVRHSYYEDGDAKDFIFKPTPATASQLQRLGLIFRNTSNGFLVLGQVRTAEEDPTLLRPLPTEAFPFAFLMILRNPYFLNFTQFPGDALPHIGQQVMYFSNRGMNNSPQLGDAISEEEGRLLQLVKRNTFNLHYSNPTRQSTPSLQDIDGNAYVPIPNIQLNPPDAVDQLQIDLRKVKNISPGRFRVQGFSPDIDQALYYDPDLNGEQILGVVDIFRDDLTADYQFTRQEVVGTETLERLNRDGDNLPVNYQISFAASSYRLTYVIHLKSDLSNSTNLPTPLIDLVSQLPQLRVIEHPTPAVATNPPIFGVPDPTPNANSEEIRISSNQLLNWQENPAQYQLIRTDRNPDLMIRTLPAPALSNPLIRDPNDPDILIQEVHVYI